MISNDEQLPHKIRVVVIGGGAAGFLGAIACAENSDNVAVTILEGTRQPLYKVGISGGGRCNVTHHCFEPEELAKAYPRGSRELLGALKVFQPKDTVAWFEQHGVQLKAEDDGRMFPVTDKSETIIECLQGSAKKAGIELRTDARVVAISRNVEQDSKSYNIELKSGETRQADKILIATGSSPQGHEFAKALGHTITPLVPSLFTFAVKDPRLTNLAGVSFPAAKLTLIIQGKKGPTIMGPLLITHWGLSGPAVLKLSAFAARHLYASRYQAALKINLVPEHGEGTLLAAFHAYREQYPRRTVLAGNPVSVPKRFWERIVEIAGVDKSVTWSHITRESLQKITRELTGSQLRISGKGEFKDEFVTCGGVKLSDVDFRTMESRYCTGLYFAGEILDIDGITGGYNFQSAWTTGWIAGRSMAGAGRCSIP